MFFNSLKIKNIQNELILLTNRIRSLELENSKLVEHIKSIRGSVNRHARDQKDLDTEEAPEEEKSKDIKGVRYY